MMQEKIIILFDGLCPLCTHTVAFLMKRDRKQRLTFIAMHSQKGRALMEQHGVTLEMNTFFLIKEFSYWIRSDAALGISRHLGGYWSFLFLFSAIPRPLRDRAYTFVARNRYRWFGQAQDLCASTEKKSGASP